MESLERNRLLRLAMPWLVMIVFFAIWELACVVFAIEEIILPRPSKVFEVIVLRFDILLKFCLQTLWEHGDRASAWRSPAACCSAWRSAPRPSSIPASIRC